MGMSDPEETPGFKLNRSDAWLPGLGRAMQRRAPALMSAGIRSGWAGLYEVTPDHNALIGESAAVSRFLYATGFSGHGFLMGPAVGEVMRDLYLNRPPGIDVGRLSADRFAASIPRPERSII
jgi:sarcosine oxidase subunit beta